MDFAILYWVLVVIMTLSALSELIPGAPGASVVLACIVIWAIATEFAGVGWPIFIVFAILMLSSAVEFFATYWGAKQFGASRWGVIGAVVGLILGVVGLLPALPFGGPIVGILFGPFIGAFLGEFLFRPKLPSDEGKSRFEVALKAGFGTVVGSFIGNLIDGMLAVLAVIVFVVTTYPLVSML